MIIIWYLIFYDFRLNIWYRFYNKKRVNTFSMVYTFLINRWMVFLDQSVDLFQIFDFLFWDAFLFAFVIDSEKINICIRYIYKHVTSNNPRSASFAFVFRSNRHTNLPDVVTQIVAHGWILHQFLARNTRKTSNQMINSIKQPSNSVSSRAR